MLAGYACIYTANIDVNNNSLQVPKKPKAFAEACLNAVDDGLNVISLCIQLGLSNFLGPCRNTAAHVSNGLRPNRYSLPPQTNGLHYQSYCLLIIFISY